MNTYLCNISYFVNRRRFLIIFFRNDSLLIDIYVHQLIRTRTRTHTNAHINRQLLLGRYSLKLYEDLFTAEYFFSLKRFSLNVQWKHTKKKSRIYAPTSTQTHVDAYELGHTLEHSFVSLHFINQCFCYDLLIF